MAEVRIPGNKQKWFLYWGTWTSIKTQKLIYFRLLYDSSYEIISVDENDKSTLSLDISLLPIVKEIPKK